MTETRDRRASGRLRLREGDIVAGHRIVEALGTGSMGTVYRAESGDSTVALKVLHPHLVASPGGFRRFLREAWAGSAVRHENVTGVCDCDLSFSQGVPLLFLVMEYVEGRTLRDVLAEDGARPEGEVRDIGRQVAAGLAAVHAAGIVHRDVKPENVLVTAGGRAVVTDLGVARVLDSVSAVTVEGQFLGSMLYGSPEHLSGSEPGPEADLYALGVLLFELLAGVNPFRRRSLAAVMDAHIREPAPRLRDAAPAASPFLDALVAALLEKDPRRRASPATDVRDALAQGERSAWWRGRSA